jgi:hypothetical protein
LGGIGKDFGFELVILQQESGVHFAFGDIKTEENRHSKFLLGEL